ncbi:RNA 2',3'-cyclic phosphodiesterase [Luedemannella helvata]|uniref:RNA 2',3'-cyclic phosphodiesterase n=1 Tax=Luedemannella helvata TaxID=349315 RepID=A0ABP4XGT2_9ACTN
MSADTLRLFVAVDPDRAAIADLGNLVDGLAVARPAPPGGSLRLTRRDAWHITLAFIGEVPATNRDKAEGAVARAAGSVAAADAVPRRRAGAAAPVGPVTVRIAGGGRFNKGRFTVLWAGLAGDLDGLGAIAAAVRRELRRAKLPVDERSFKPHLTIARPGDRLAPDALAADLDALAGYTGPAWTVSEVLLYASEPGPKPRYTRLFAANVGTVTLGGANERG